MKILYVHDRYQVTGGEESSAVSERRMLERHGHEVIAYDRDNTEIAKMGRVRRASLLMTGTWDASTFRDISRMVRRHRPDVAHVRNIQPLISPSVYWALDRLRVPVVQTLDNFRLFCPATTFLRDGRVCEECSEHSLARSVAYACFRGSRVQTFAVAQSLWVHRMLGTWTHKIDRYIALTEFGRRKFIDCGLPADRIAIKPHFLEAPPVPRFEHDGYAIFVGRLSPEKGLLTLLRAWRELPWLPLRIVGDGPLRAEVEGQIRREEVKSVELLGHMGLEQCLEQLRGARFLVFPSEWYEGLPRVIVEAYACGKAVVASGLGAMNEIILSGITGAHFTPGDAEDLARTVRRMTESDTRTRQLGRAARNEFEAKYTEERNYRQLMEIYESAIGSRNGA